VICLAVYLAWLKAQAVSTPVNPATIYPSHPQQPNDWLHRTGPDSVCRYLEIRRSLSPLLREDCNRVGIPFVDTGIDFDRGIASGVVDEYMAALGAVTSSAHRAVSVSLCFAQGDRDASQDLQRVQEAQCLLGPCDSLDPKVCFDMYQRRMEQLPERKPDLGWLSRGLGQAIVGKALCSIRHPKRNCSAGRGSGLLSSSNYSPRPQPASRPARERCRRGRRKKRLRRSPTIVAPVGNRGLNGLFRINGLGERRKQEGPEV
jgi:hypothetical protein